MIKKLFYFLFFLSFLATAVACYGLYYLVVVEPGDEIDEKNIEMILGKESPVFYNDDKTKLGVFFDKAHRQYVRYSEIPADFVNALVAAEDNRFFNHFGFDPAGIARAAVRNIQAGRVVQGGSTLTQQTAKNLFKRTERSLKAKAKELLFALRLEYRYPKEKIFEFYANQFYVSGNGHGLGIAARYYFNKKPSELNLVECAFIAGSVKRPNYYNPFIKKGKDAVELAKKRAKIRLKYVFDKMLELGMITHEEYKVSLADEIGFNKGQVGYSLDYIMEMVKDAVSSTEVLDSLAEHGIDNVSTSGVRIITTVDKTLQEKSLYTLRHDLSRLDISLRGYEREEVQKEYAELTYNGDEKLEVGKFRFGSIAEVVGEGDTFKLVVDFGDKFGKGVVTKVGLERFLDPIAKWRRNRWAKKEKKDFIYLTKQFQPGDKIWTSVREVDEFGDFLLDLEKYPSLQGAAMVMKNGKINAMVGGTENRFYNRAVYAKRTMGSSFKPFVYAAALQLGWTPSDLLKNGRDVFVYHNQPYFPRPDHTSPHEYVSMNWAGTKSENIASIWLLTHLCDYLNSFEFREVAEYLDLAPKVVDGEKEPYKSYRSRVRDQYGIVVNQGILVQAAFRAAIRNCEADFMFENMLDEYIYLKSLNYGNNYTQYDKQLHTAIKQGSKLTQREKNELWLRRDLLRVNYLSISELNRQLQEYRNYVDDPFGFQRANSGKRLRGDFNLYKNMQTGRYVFTSNKPKNDDLIRMSKGQVQDHLFDMTDMQRNLFWQKVLLYDKLSVAGLELLQEQMKFELKRVQRELPYSFEVLSDVDDFRIYVGMKYLIALAREMGISSSLKPVLSFPLGSNVVTLLETTRMYEGLVTGKITTYGTNGDGEDNSSLMIIDRIESEDGTVLYQPTRHEKTVLSEKSRLGVGNILENVVKFGTGRRADRAVKLVDEENEKVNEMKLSVPLLGKTGTANRYTNASFFGYLPGMAEDGTGLSSINGYAVGSYVGFDNNREMRKDTIKVAGASGALPTWIDIVKTLIDEGDYSGKLDIVDLSFSGLSLKRDEAEHLQLVSNPDSGGALTNPVRVASARNRYQPSVLTFGRLSPSGRFTPERNFEPFWRVAETEE